ncbi:hypothetical protein FNV43_RR01057 [Rhamnella rubrinervis]|uniref:gibberellin 2beta-dioxygenase n=1 Tax=Rhamnella rubrinervis TaxID=2594499 RepID=A0A8K0HNX9_9ROSA|nr:hypothetical protein FNV43_RR01057 [Rhamnella rubrinervis]
MVVATQSLIFTEKIEAIELPIIDLSADRSKVSKLIVKACEKYGFFKVINHGVPHDTISKLEQESLSFFSKPFPQKQRSGPANPFGYGCKTIGFNGDVGEVEYILLHTNPHSIAQCSKTLSCNPIKFSSAVIGYIEAIRRLACEILELMADGLWVSETSVFSRLIRDVDNDSIFRLNHYPPFCTQNRDASPRNITKIGFGEHTDPQILTLLRSNDVCGLQISLEPGVWVPVPPDPTAFWINVGDVLQVMTNERFKSVKHRAITNSLESRMSMAYFAAPPLGAKITALPETVTPERPPLYRAFTWAEYKKTVYALRLGDNRSNLYRLP